MISFSFFLLVCFTLLCLYFLTVSLFKCLDGEYQTDNRNINNFFGQRKKNVQDRKKCQTAIMFAPSKQYLSFHL